jgi:hypothetical protein
MSAFNSESVQAVESLIFRVMLKYKTPTWVLIVPVRKENSSFARHEIESDILDGPEN